MDLTESLVPFRGRGTWYFGFTNGEEKTPKGVEYRRTSGGVRVKPTVDHRVLDPGCKVEGSVGPVGLQDEVGTGRGIWVYRPLDLRPVVVGSQKTTGGGRPECRGGPGEHIRWDDPGVGAHEHPPSSSPPPPTIVLPCLQRSILRPTESGTPNRIGGCQGIGG